MQDFTYRWLQHLKHAIRFIFAKKKKYCLYLHFIPEVKTSANDENQK